MTIELILALVGFAFVSSITPGPNNMMLMASGANFGLRRSLPHMLGVGIGHSLMILIIGAGLITLFERFPMTLIAMKWGSVAYLLYLSWKIANAAPKTTDPAQPDSKPFTFFQAAAFQWVNPKGWFMALTAISAYTVDQSFTQVALVALIFLLTNMPSISVWTVLGQQARRFLNSPARLRAFNFTMAVLLVLPLIPIIRGH